MKQTLFVAALLLAVSSFAQDGKLSFQKGQKLELLSEMKKTSNMEVMGQSMETTTTSSYTEIFDIEDVTAQGTVIEHKIKNFKFSAEGMMGVQTFDSEKESDMKGDIGKMMEKMLKNKYTMILDPFGTVVSVKLDDDNPNASKNADEEAMANMVSMQMGANLQLPKQGSPSMFKILPARAIKTGDTWIDSTSEAGTIRKVDYKVNNISDFEIVLDYIEDVTVNSTQQMMGQEATISMKMKSTGKITLDRKSGVLKMKTGTIDTEGTVEAQGMAIPVTEKSTFSIMVKPA